MKKFFFMFLLGLQCIFAFSQQKTVSGVVSDEDGNPLIGAGVVIVGTTNGVNTDLDGKFEISVAPGQELTFSYIGYESQTVAVTSETSRLVIKLKSSAELEEVVVIGYGTVKKKDLVGAVSSVSAKDLQANVARSTSAALQGRIPGMTVSSNTGQPGEGLSINIRGISSLSSTTPLYVIDGVYGDINMVDPSDIESIEVLKDASAAAIYGSRAANGVVLITTKTGKLDTPTRVSVDLYSGIQNVERYLDLMDGNQFRDFSKATGYCTAEDVLNWTGGKGTDWQKEIFRTASIDKVSLNVSGGNKTSTYDISGSYLYQDGIVKSTDYDAWNIRSKNTASLFNNHFRLGSTIMLKIWNKKYDSLAYDQLVEAVPMWEPYDEDGNWGIAPSWTRGDNPVGVLEAYDNQNHGVDILINAYAEVDLGLKGLKYKFNVGVNRYNTRSYNYEEPYYFSSSSQNPDYKLSEGSSWEKDWLIENTINYDNTFGKHTIQALAGYSAQKNKGRSIGAGRNGMAEGLTVIDAGSTTTQSTSGSAWANTLISGFGRLMYSYDNRYMLSASIRHDGSSKFADGHRWGTFPSIAVGWNIMNENFFSEAKEVMNELKLRASYGVLGNLNGIGDYATQSTVTTGLNNVQGTTLWEGASTGVAWVAPSDVTWEKTKTLNIGVDLGFLNDKFNFTADVFNQKTEDMLLEMPQPASFGLSGSPTVNAGTVENKGVELSFNHRNNIGDFFYHVGINATFLKNELTKVNGSRDEWEGYNPHAKGVVTYAKTGYPIGFFYLIKTDGIFHNQEEIDSYVDSDGNLIQPNAQPGDLKFVDANGDGTIDNNDRQDCGSAFPKVSLGINLGASWRNFDMTLFFDGNFGNKIYNALYYETVYNQVTGNQYARRMDSWTAENPNTDEPRYISGNDNNGTNWGYTDRWLESGSFLRLKTLEFGYELPSHIVSKMKMSRLRVYTAMENLFTITKYKGYTPDLGPKSSVMMRGCDDGRYPLARVITFGAQINF